MCETCKSEKCSLAGTHNPHMTGRNVCTSNPDYKKSEKPRSGYQPVEDGEDYE